MKVLLIILRSSPKSTELLAAVYSYSSAARYSTLPLCHVDCQDVYKLGHYRLSDSQTGTP